MTVNPTLRGFAIIALVAGVITALRLENALAAFFLVVQIAFIVAIAFFALHAVAPAPGGDRRRGRAGAAWSSTAPPCSRS